MTGKSRANGVAALMAAILMLCAGAQAAPQQASEMLGENLYYTAGPGDTPAGIARHFNTGYQALLDANKGLAAGNLRPGTVLALPTAHVLPPLRHPGIVINKAELRLYHFAEDGSARSFPVSIGKSGWATPAGETKVVKKREKPTWIPPASLKAEDPSLPDFMPPGPNNPLGEYALNLGWSGFAIHGTSAPSSIGRRVSHGCIRMYPEDIKTLFNLIREGDKVTIIDAPYKLGWRSRVLYLQIAPARRAAQDAAAADIKKAVRAYAGDDAQILWETVEAAIRSRNGLPVPVAVTQGRSRIPPLAARESRLQ